MGDDVTARLFRCELKPAKCIGPDVLNYRPAPACGPQSDFHAADRLIRARFRHHATNRISLGLLGSEQRELNKQA